MSISGIGSQGGSPPNGPPPGGAQVSGASGGSSSSSGPYDVKDTNKDGKVSLQEELAYAIKNPSDGSDTENETSTIDALFEKMKEGQQYDSQGNKSINTNETQSAFLSLYA